MTEVIGKQINNQLTKLHETIQSHNNQGDGYGLLSRHILKEVSEWRFELDVLCDDKWIAESFDEKNVYDLASLGYSIHSGNLNNSAEEKFVKAFDLLSQRDPFKGPHVTFPFQPVTLLGLTLGVKNIKDMSWQEKASEWLEWILNERTKKGEISGYHELLYSYIRYQLTGKINEIKDLSKYRSIEELSILEYALRRNIFKGYNQETALEKIRKELINQLVKSDITGAGEEKAAIIWAAANESITIDVSNLLLSPHFVSAILSRFEDSMKRWRYDSDELKKPIKWPIGQEREVQDILWLVLRSYFEDLVDEEALPKFGHKFYKPDFAIPSLRLLIEVKFAYKKEDFKSIEQEIMVDTIGYLHNTQGYDKIIIFIYDNSGSVQEHGTTIRDLIKIKEIEDVIIVSKPSQLP
jgi:hypothetical protein